MTQTGMRVLVAGATGRTGRVVLARLAETAATVRAFTRDADARDDLLAQGADEVVVGDLLDAEDAQEAVVGVDAVISVVGSTPGIDAIRGNLVDGDGIINLIDAATAAGVSRFVLCSSIGVGDSKDGIPLSMRAILTAAGVLSAKKQSESRLRDSSLIHTIIRPGALTDAPATGEILVGEGGDSVSGSIPRADVADVLVRSLFTEATENRTFEIVSRLGLRNSPNRLVELPWGGPSVEPAD
ncbi:SDR family oxidoreductase [Haloferax sp. DFSO60]|uniref:SDR family oxidoreductase n=1 Tax=Haloferax sp. DFSO60 TaxID=3388652 RepID=UPI00397D34B9